MLFAGFGGFEGFAGSGCQGMGVGFEGNVSGVLRARAVFRVSGGWLGHEARVSGTVGVVESFAVLIVIEGFDGVGGWVGV